MGMMILSLGECVESYVRGDKWQLKGFKTVCSVDNDNVREK